MSFPYTKINLIYSMHYESHRDCWSGYLHFIFCTSLIARAVSARILILLFYWNFCVSLFYFFDCCHIVAICDSIQLLKNSSCVRIYVNWKSIPWTSNWNYLVLDWMCQSCWSFALTMPSMCDDNDFDLDRCYWPLPSHFHHISHVDHLFLFPYRVYLYDIRYT